MAALALRPHARHDEYSARLRRLDFALMMVWWMYLYVFSVMAWQYVVPNVLAYDNNLNFLYLIEKLAFLTALFVAWWNSKESWKTLHANLFGASLLYASSSYLANWAIGREVYYSGSMYDIPLVISMAWLTVIGLWARDDGPQTETHSSFSSHGVWLARVGMITVFSLPLLAGLALLEPGVPARIRAFRLILTLGAALAMGVMVFVRQRILDRELLRLLTQSRESFANLKRLQAQIMESEKLASIGQLVGGAAHELNNPITAMLGYSDLLLSTSLSSGQRDLAAKIGREVRRTRSLVASLISFAKQGPSALASVDLRTVLCTAVKVSEPVSQALKIDVHTDFPSDLPVVIGDSNQLLQVYVQILNNALNAADQLGSRRLTVGAKHKDGIVTVSVADFPAAAPSLDRRGDGQDPASLAGPHPLHGFGFGACQGILQQQYGRIYWDSENPGISIRIELPVTPPLPEKAAAAAAPAAWQAQPFS
jgi:signal transduction histidine kinase